MAKTPTKYVPLRQLRMTTRIGRKQITTMKPAVRLAHKRGHPLNCFVTLNFTHAACESERVSRAFQRVRDYYTRWLRGNSRKRRKKDEPAFIWVIENANQLAAHWLVHIPPELEKDFARNLPFWFAKAAGGPAVGLGAIDIRPAYNPIGAVKYMGKGIDPAYADLYRINHIPQGLVHGKRCGFSQNLGPASCRRERTYWAQISKDSNSNQDWVFPKQRETRTTPATEERL